MRVLALLLKTGSSPQVRGKLEKYLAKELAERLIPAGAGKTQTVESYPTGKPAHPRRCGENFQLIHHLA